MAFRSDRLGDLDLDFEDDRTCFMASAFTLTFLSLTRLDLIVQSFDFFALLCFPNDPLVVSFPFLLNDKPSMDLETLP